MTRNNFNYIFSFTAITVLISLALLPLTQSTVSPYMVTIGKIDSTYHAYDRSGSVIGSSDNLLELCNQQADAISKGTFYFVGGDYVFSDEWVISKEINVVGEGETATTLSFAQGGILYNGISACSIRDLTIAGSSTEHSSGITLDSTGRMSIYNVYIAHFNIGLNIIRGMFTSIFNPFIIENDVGVWIGSDFGTARFFGGSIILNRVGVEIYGGNSDSTMNQFYGVEMECNTDCEVFFNGAYGMVSGTIFQGVYFERTSNTSPFFFKYAGELTQIKCITWTGCKFASQIESTLDVYGEGHVFDGNFFDGVPVYFTLMGALHSVTNNKALTEESAHITFRNNAERTIVSGNYFLDVETNTTLPVVSGLCLLGFSAIGVGALMKIRRG